MIRTTLLALVAAAGIGSTAFAAQGLDGDANPVPGTTVVQRSSGLENSFAGPYRPMAPATIQDKGFFDRPSQVH